jgi:hypothetical protein
MYALEFLGIMSLGANTSLGYLQQLQKLVWKHPGFSYDYTADKLFRTEVDDKMRDSPSSKWEEVFEQTLDNGAWIWNQAIAEVQQASLIKAGGGQDGHQVPGTPKGKGAGKRGLDGSTPPGKRSRGASQRENKKQQLQQLQAQLQQTTQPPPPPPPAKGAGKAKAAGKGAGKTAIPAAEFQKLLTLKQKNTAGTPICRWFNCSLGCSRPACSFAHECAECGQAHPYAGNH